MGSRPYSMQHEMGQPMEVPWTFAALTQNLLPGEFEDVSGDRPDEEEFREKVAQAEWARARATLETYVNLRHASPGAAARFLNQLSKPVEKIN